MEKEFDLIKVLEDSVKKLDYDAVAIKSRAETLNEVVEFIKTNKLKVTQTVDEATEEETPETK